jgi:hypothetical protein
VAPARAARSGEIVMDARLAPLVSTLRLNTRLLLNCLDGLEDAAGDLRPNERTNSLAFVAAHLVDARHLLARVIGLHAPPPYGGILEHARTIDDVPSVPPLSATRPVWRDITTRVEERLLLLEAVDLDAPAPQRYPIDDRSVLGAIAFLMQHDAYHIGQMALIRKYQGMPAMRYA